MVPAITAGSAAEAEVRAAAETEVERLRSLIGARQTAYRATLTPEDRAEEQWKAQQIGPWNGELKVGWTARGSVRHLWSWRMRIPVDPALGGSPLAVAREFLARHGQIFGLSDATVAVDGGYVRPIRDGAPAVVRFHQVMNGLPVFGSNLLLRVGAEGDIQGVGGHLVPESAIPSAEPAFTPDAPFQPERDVPELGYWDPEIAGAAPGPVRLVWRVSGIEESEEEDLYVDALDGSELARVSRVDHDEHREVFECSSCTLSTQLPGALHYDDACHAGGDATCPPSSGCSPNPPCETTSPPASIADLKTYTKNVYDYYNLEHGRDSWDDNQCGTGHPTCTNPALHRMRASTAGQGGNFGGSCKAGWRWLTNSVAPAQAWFQDLYTSVPRDVVGHEFTHAVDNVEGDLNALGTGPDQGRQLDEAVPDVFGELIEHHATGAADWVHGTGSPCCCWRNTNYVDVTLGGPFCGALNPSAPPDHWSFYAPLASCSLPNYSATMIGKIGYLMARDPSAVPLTHWGLSVRGLGPVTTGKVWYQALTTGTWSTQTFAEFAYALLDGCDSHTTGQDFVECFLAGASIGIWSYDTVALDDSNESWNVNVEPAIAYHTVQPNQRWLFYKDPIANNLWYRTRTCAVHDTNCSWTGPVLMDTTIASAPRATTYDDYTAWVCFRNTSGVVECDRIGVFGNVIHGPDPAGASLSDAPSLVRSNGALYLTYRRNGKVYWRTYTTATGWGSEMGPVATGVGSAPVLASADEDRYAPGTNLWLLYRTSAGRIAYRLFDHPSSTWGAERLVGRPPEVPAVDYRPGAAVYRGRLHVAGRTGSSMYYASCGMPCDGNSNDWTRWVKQDGDTNVSPFLDAYGANDGFLYMWHNVASSNAVHWRGKLSE